MKNTHPLTDILATSRFTNPIAEDGQNRKIIAYLESKIVQIGFVFGDGSDDSRETARRILGLDPIKKTIGEKFCTYLSDCNVQGSLTVPSMCKGLTAIAEEHFNEKTTVKKDS